jgi:hypothetical protein
MVAILKYKFGNLFVCDNAKVQKKKLIVSVIW